jgi:hypothetical protein
MDCVDVEVKIAGRGSGDCTIQLSYRAPGIDRAVDHPEQPFTFDNARLLELEGEPQDYGQELARSR